MYSMPSSRTKIKNLVIMDEKLVVIIVLYCPDEAALERIRQLSNHVVLIVVDNTPNSSINLEGTQIQYHWMGDNKGIAAAQNAAIYRALSTDAEYVLFLDQDSCMAVQEMKNLIAVYRQISMDDKKIGALGPLPIEKDSGETYKSSLTGKSLRICKVGNLISSGMLTTPDVIRGVGYMDASLFIDYVDFEWCWRASSKGYHLYLTDKVSLAHKLGERTLTIGQLSFVVSAPIRYYYRTRNFLFLCRRNYVPCRWKIRTLIKTIIEPFFILTGPAYCHQRELICKYYFKGIYDGIKKSQSLGLS